MCGIFAYVGPETDVASLVYSGLKELEYRGYDSWGIAVGRDGETIIVRDVGKLPQLVPTSINGTVGIGHTRWATTGAVTVGNAHPHKFDRNQIAVVHNGIVENYIELKEEVIRKGIVLSSQTDTEVAGALVGIHIENEGCSLEDAVSYVAGQVKGHGAFVFVDPTGEKVVAYKTGSPLYIGRFSDSYMLASDPGAFPESTSEVARISDGEIIAVSRGKAMIKSVNAAEWQPVEFEVLGSSRVRADLEGHPFYLIKEIREQPAILRTISESYRGDDEISRMCKSAGEIWLTGCGTAYHAACVAAAIFCSNGRKARAIHAHELAYAAKAIQADDCVIALTQSGETIDVIDAVRLARKATANVAAFVNVAGSAITHEVSQHRILGAGPERSVLSTKTFLAKLAQLLLLIDGEAGKADIEIAANAIERMFSAWMLRSFKDLARSIAASENLFVLGSGDLYPLALEGALKIKEVSYIHAEGFPAGELKHGVISLIERGTPVIALVPSDASRERVIGAVEQVKARGAYTIGISARNEPSFDKHILCDTGGHAFTMAAAVPFQLLGYYVALEKGLDPDRPRNLAKSVTVR